MLEHRPVLDAVDEVLDGQHFRHVLALVSKLRRALDVSVVRLVLILDAESQEPSRRRSNVRAGEVAHEGGLEVDPGVDAVGLQAVQPSLSRTLQHERDIANRDALVAAGDPDCDRVVGEPVFWLDVGGVLGSIAR